MRIDVEDKRYSNSTTITSSDAGEEGYFASVVTVQHNQKSGEQVSNTQESEWKKVSWPNEEALAQRPVKDASEGRHRATLVQGDHYATHQQQADIDTVKPFGWINAVADSSHHLVSEAEMELQKRAFDVKHANDRSRSRSRSHFISDRARSFERAQAYGSEGPPPPLRRGRSPSLRRMNEGEWISQRPEDSARQELVTKSRQRWASVGRLDTSPWETRIRQESPAPVPPAERNTRRRHLTGEPQPPKGSLKDTKVTEWIRKSQDCLVNNGEHSQSHGMDFESSRIETNSHHHQSVSHCEAQHYRQEQQQYLLQMEEEKRRTEAEIRRQTEELRRKELEAKKKELDMLRRKEEASAKEEEKEQSRRREEIQVRQKAEARRVEETRRHEEELVRRRKDQMKQRQVEEENRRREMEIQERQKAEARRIEETRRRELEILERQKAEARRIEETLRIEEETIRQRKYEEQLKQRHMEEERRKEQKLLYEKRIQKEKEEQTRLQKLQMEQRQERVRKQQVEETATERQQKEEHQFEKRGQESSQESRSRTRHRSRERHYSASEQRPENPRPLTPVGVRTGHVNSKRHFFNERSKSVDRKEDVVEPRHRQRCHLLKDWAHNANHSSEDADPPSRPGSSLGQSLGAVKHSVDNWNHSATQQIERPSSRVRSHSHHRDWKPTMDHRPTTPNTFESVSTHQVQDTVKDWGAGSIHTQPPSGRSTPLAPSRVIGESFADSKLDSKEWNHSEEDAPWRVKTPDLKLVNISVKRSVPNPLRNRETSSDKEGNTTTAVPNRNIYITELPDLPLQKEVSQRVESSSSSRVMMASTTTTSSKTYHQQQESTKDLPLPLNTESWFQGGGKCALSPTSSASTLAHLEGLKSPTETGKTPLPVLAGWYDSSKPAEPSRGGGLSNNAIPPAPPLPQSTHKSAPKSSATPEIQKYENDVDKRARELEELRNMRADRNKRLQDAFELGDPYSVAAAAAEIEDSVVSSYSDDGYSEDEELGGVKKEPSKPVPTRRIGNLFNRSGDEWVEDQGPCPPQRNSSKEFMKALKS